MKLTENLKSIHEVMATMSQLEDPQFIQDNGVTEEELPLILEDLKKQLESHKEEVQGYLEYKLTERQEHVILSNGIGDQIKLLSERKTTEDKRIGNIDKRIDYLCRISGIEKMKTPLGEIKYTGGEKIMIEDISSVPSDFIVYGLGEDIRPIDIGTFKELGYEINKIASRTLVKKRYKELPEEDKKKYEGKIWIDNSKSLSVKQ